MQADASESRATTAVLTVRAAGRACALPLQQVIEVLRPLPVQTLAGMPDFLLGLAVLRGTAVPVLDLAALLDGAKQRHTRWLHLRAGARRLALAVEQVGRVEDLAGLEWQPLPPLFDGDASAAVRQLAQRDRELYLQLNVMRLLPDALWHRIDASS